VNFALLRGALSPAKPFFHLMQEVDRIALQEAKTAGVETSRASMHHRPAWLKLVQPARMDFAAREVESIEICPPASDGQQSQLLVTIRHFGLFAPLGPMPLHITEHALREKIHERNAGFERFAAMLSADFAWLDYKVWSHMRPTTRGSHARPENTFVRRVAQFAAAKANGSASTDKSQAEIARLRAQYPGLYTNRQRPLHQLAKLLSCYYRVSVQALLRTGGWQVVPPSRAASTSRRRLGQWLLGSRIFAPQTAFTLLIGPLEMHELAYFHRTQPALRTLVDIARDYVGDRLDVRVAVDVNTRRGMNGAIGRMRLGIDTWASPTDRLIRVIVHEVNMRSKV